MPHWILLGRRFLGIDINDDFLQISKARKEEINGIAKQKEYISKLQQQAKLFGKTTDSILLSDAETLYTKELPF